MANGNATIIVGSARHATSRVVSARHVSGRKGKIVPL